VISLLGNYLIIVSSSSAAVRSAAERIDAEPPIKEANLQETAPFSYTAAAAYTLCAALPAEITQQCAPKATPKTSIYMVSFY
jgi:hypothetical protein